MQIRNLVSVIALSACTLAPLTSSAASLFGRDGNTPAPVVKADKKKNVKMTFKNTSAEAMTVIVNDQPITLAANASTEVRAADGSNVLAADGTSVKLHVTSALNNGTISFR